VLCTAVHNTYVRTWTGWPYLATVIDWGTREVIGWSMADQMGASLVCDAISMAAGSGQLQPGAIFHSDLWQSIHQQRIRRPFEESRYSRLDGSGSVNAGIMRSPNRFLVH
jgi:transposase InsO family protein